MLEKRKKEWEETFQGKILRHKTTCLIEIIGGNLVWTKSYIDGE